MNAELESLARRFAQLSAPKRRIFLERLKGEGLDFATLPIVRREPAPSMPSTSMVDPAGSIDAGRPAPLACAQRGLWLAWQRAPQSPAYNLAGRLTLRGAVTPDAVAAAVRGLVERHATLRTRFGIDADGQPEQRVRPAGDAGAFEWTRREWSVPRGGQDEALHACELDFARRPFDLAQGAVFRAALHVFEDDVLELLLGVHHIAADGSSVDQLMQELVGDLQGHGVPAPSPVEYADYATWQRDWLEAGEQDRQLAYWREQLSGLPAATALPLDRARGRSRGGRDPHAGGELVSFQLDPGVSAALVALGRQHAASPYMVTVALLNLLVFRYAGETDVCIGLPTVNRDRVELESVVGHFTNVLPLRTRIDPEAGFLALLRQVRQGLLDAKRNAELPLDLLVEQLGVERQPGLHPFFQIKSAQQTTGVVPGRAAGDEVAAGEGDGTGEGAGAEGAGSLQVSARGILVEDVHFDLSLDVVVDGDRLGFDLAYATQRFDRVTIDRLIEAFHALAAQAAREPQRAIGEMTLPGAASALIGEARATSADSVPAMFTAFAEARGTATALVQRDRRIGYDALARAVDLWATQLRARGIGPERRVAICIDRSPEFVLAMLAVMRAGAAFVPLDPTAPPDRLRQVLQDSGAVALMSTASQEWAASVPTFVPSFDANINVDEALAASAPLPMPHPDQAAYVIYTSGSTGRPKGVVVSHGALANYVLGLLSRLALPAGASFAMISTVAADLGHTALFGALCSGGALHLPDAAEAFDPDAFAAHMARHPVDVLKIVPSHLRGLLNAREAASVLPARALVLGGEAADEALLRQVRALRPDLRVINHYGPTETTVGMLTHALAPADPAPDVLPLGRPLAGMSAYVLDERMNLLQPGMAGELFVGGPGVARGYLGQPGLTASRFVASPFADGERLYRSGDRVRLRSDGTLSFLGRVDDQVKIRGYRVEPGELQGVLRESPDVADAFVIAGTTDEGRSELWAYVVPRNGASIDVDVLQAGLRQRVPAYLLPAALMVLPALPLSANGKVDRRALPRPARPEADDASAGPGGKDGERMDDRDPSEQALAALWGDLLNLPPERIRREDSFFDLGGDSVLSLKLIARIRRQVKGGDRLSLPAVMQAANLGELAAALRRGLEESHDAVRLAPGPAAAGVPLYCVPGMIVNTREFSALAEALGRDRPVHAFVSHVYTGKRWRGFSIPALAAEYADYIAATAPGARCALLGWSSGGDLAHEVTRLLKGRVDVRFAAMVDVFETEPLRTDTPPDDAQNALADARLDEWLARSTMADRWRELLARMDEPERACVAAHALRGEPPLPLDGDAEDAAEYLLWTTLDKRVQATRYRHEAGDTPLHVYQAEASLGADGTLRDWSAVAPVVATRHIPASTHLDIIRSPALLADLAEQLADVDRRA